MIRSQVKRETQASLRTYKKVNTEKFVHGIYVEYIF